MVGITGRAELADALSAAWASARVGAGGVIVLLGEPGIGKSSMLAWLADHLGPAAHLVVCHAGGPMSIATELTTTLTHPRADNPAGHRDAAPPGRPGLARPHEVEDAPTGRAHEVEDAPAGRPHAGEGAPTGRFGAGEDAPTGPFGAGEDAPTGRFGVGEVDPLRVADLLVARLGAAAEAGPFAVLVDDIHEADPASRTALNLALRRASWGNALVVVTGRVVPEAVAFAEGFRVCRMRGLDSASASTVLRAASPVPIAEPVERRLLAVAAGNPLALTHLPAALTADQLGGAHLLPDDIPLAGDLHRVFTSQLARLTPAARELLELAAVSGDGNWSVLTALRPADPGTALAELENAGLAELTGGRLVPAHPLLRSAATTALPAHRLRALNRELAEVATLPAEVRLTHRAAGTVGPDEPLVDELVAVAGRLRACGGTEAAARILDRAVDLTGNDLRRSRLRLDAAQLLGAAGAAGVARHRLGEVLADPTAESLHVPATLTLATLEALDGEPLAAWQRLLECAALASPAEVGAVHARMAIPLGMLGLVEQIIEQSRTAVRCSAPGSPGWAVARMTLAHSLSARDEGQAGALVADLLDDLDPVAVIDHDPTVGLQLGRALSIAERYDTAVTLLTALSGRAKGEGARSSLAMTYGALGETHLRASRFDQATRYLDEAIAISLATGQRAFAPFWLALRARVAATRGDDAAAAADLALGFDIATAQSTFGARYFLLANSGHAALAAGRHPDAVRDLAECWAFEQASGRLAPQLARWHPDLVEACVALGRHDEARPVLAHLRAVAAAPGASRWTRASARRAEAVFRAADDPAAARTLLDEAIALYNPEDDLFDRARACLQQAALSGPTAKAAADQASYAFDRLRAAPWSARLATLTDTPPPSAVADLSAAELRVLREVARGLTNQQIATRLRLSPKTVANHLFRVYRKLGASSRTEAARLLLLDG